MPAKLIIKVSWWMAMFGVAVTLAPVCADESWHMAKLMRAALDSHPSIAGKRSSRKAAEADLDGAEWLRYPSLTLEANNEDNGQRGRTVRLDQPLWAGGKITAGIDAATSRVGASQAAVDEAQQDLALRVVVAMSEALRQKERQEIVRTSLAEHERLLEMIQRRVKQEVSPQADERLAESRMLSVLNEGATIAQALDSALAQLSQLVGQPVSQISTTGFQEAAIGEFSDLNGLLRRVLDNSPTLRRLVHETEAANADIESKRSTLSPQIVLRYEDTHARSNGTEKNDHRVFLMFQAQSGAGLSSFSGVDAAIARREAIHLSRDEAERTIRERVTVGANEWRSARDRLANAERVRAASAEVADSYARQYMAGRKSWLDVLNSVREAGQSDLSLVDARYQMLSAALRLKIHLGSLQ